jgi:hypothetical protein
VGGARGQVAPGTSVVRPTAVLRRRLQRDGSQCAQRHKGGGAADRWGPGFLKFNYNSKTDPTLIRSKARLQSSKNSNKNMGQQILKR